MSFCKQWKSCFMLQPVQCAVLPLTLLNSGCSDGGVAPSLYSCSILKCVEQAAKEEKWNISIQDARAKPSEQAFAAFAVSSVFSHGYTAVASECPRYNKRFFTLDFDTPSACNNVGLGCLCRNRVWHRRFS